MAQAIKTVELVIVVVVLLVTAFCNGKSVAKDKSDGKVGKEKEGKNCTNVKCKDPPANGKCTVMSKKERKSVPTPKGKQAECCPLWKCQNKTKSGEPEFYTFHGLLGNILNPGGTETVNYRSTGLRAANGKPIYNMVSSKATGGHNSIAMASDTGMSEEEMMKEMDSAFANAGIKM